MTGFRACILLAVACAAYGGYVVPTYGAVGYPYGGYVPYGAYRAPYGVYRAPVYHTVPAPVKYVVHTPAVEAKVTDTYETQPSVPVSVSKTYTTTPVHTTVAVPAATKVVTYPTYSSYPTYPSYPTYYGYGVSPYGLSYGYGVGGYQYVPVLKK
ncbi:uncharacterized protein [Dermacentor andersoni]|uniref:uncharacterized protein n=1 Tax=Dermacentor andersoni TaxID=34620 RepID=UPI00241794BD|nr:shematrin-like protein 1 [Dermacentor andersoni]